MTLEAVLDATWPAAQTHPLGPLTLRRSPPGGGARVTAATLDGSLPPDPGLLDQAMAQMRNWGQSPLFRVRQGQARFDACLAARGFARCDPTVFYACASAMLAENPSPRLSSFEIWPPLAIQAEIWDDAGICAARRAVMKRADGPRTALLGRLDDQPAATAFVAAHDGTAMVHALEVRPALRRRGAARTLMAAAALWALQAGCAKLAVAVTEANAPARALYAGLGMAEAGRYHYRKGDADA